MDVTLVRVQVYMKIIVEECLASWSHDNDRCILDIKEGLQALAICKGSSIYLQVK